MLINLEQSIEQFNNGKNYSNNATRYLPIGPQLIKDQDLNWSLVYKMLYENLLGLESNIQSLDALYEEISSKISNNRDTRELLKLVENVYLNETALKAISPYTNLVCNEKAKARTSTMMAILSGMLSGFKSKNLNFNGANVIEAIINDIFKSQCISRSQQNSDLTYLPFLANAFCCDLDTLSSNTQWLLEEVDNLVELYSFLYLTQLSVHLSESNHRFEKPCSREVYFILETETASKERHECNHKGFDRIFSNRTGFSSNIFPHLGYLELISDLPVWAIAEQATDKDIQRINSLNKLLCKQYTISFSGDKETVQEAINDGLFYHKELFKKNSLSSDRYGANEKVISVFRDSFSQNYKSNRRAAGGWYFQLNTKTILLLTNLIISRNKKMLIDDVIDGFASRGVYFDLKSRNALLKVYENIGNIEKLSDSGDAVYVKSTI